MHPGGEPGYNRKLAGKLPWNTGEKHKRKCIRHLVKCWDEKRSDEIGPREMYLWGEWEAPSSYERIQSKDPLAPRAVHRIIQPVQFPKEKSTHQNTDPFVFGERFVYTNCQQPKKPILRDLDPGSIIVFGSCKDKRFRLDTVFVVGKKRTPLDLKSESLRDILDSELYRKVTIWPLREEHVIVSSGKPISVYGGSMQKDRTNELPIFSFVPCQDKPFARPVLPRLAEQSLITDTFSQGIKKTVLESIEDSKRIWQMIVDDVTDAGLQLGTSVIIS